MIRKIKTIIDRLILTKKIHASVKRIDFSEKDEAFCPITLDFLSYSEKQKVLRDADLLLAGSYQIFNYPEYVFSDWHTDPVTGTKIIPQLSTRLISTKKYIDKVDIKNLWDQSHLYGLTVLAEGYSFTKDVKYAQKAEEFLLDFIKKNPLDTSIAWKCAMDCGIRLANITVSVGLIRDYLKHSQNTNLFYQSIWEHVLLIREDYENKTLFTNNHYLSALVGVLWGCFFLIINNGFHPAGDILREAIQMLCMELEKQVFDDGTDYEGSTYYHCFVAELISETVQLIDLSHEKVPELMRSKADKLRGICHYYGAFDYGIPLIGDQDGSRLFLLKGMFDVDRCNYSSLERFGITFPEGQPNGMFRLENKVFRVYVKCGSIGTGGKGTHDHNDALSVCIYAFGKPLVIDSGTYIYSANSYKRALYRSEAMHSVLSVVDCPQSEVRKDMFGATNYGKTTGKAKGNSFEGKYTYVKGTEWMRSVCLHQHKIVINDTLAEGSATSRLILPFSIDSMHQSIDGVVYVQDVIRITALGTISIKSSEYSPAYGISKPCVALEVEVSNGVSAFELEVI